MFIQKIIEEAYDLIYITITQDPLQPNYAYTCAFFLNQSHWLEKAMENNSNNTQLKVLLQQNIERLKRNQFATLLFSNRTKI